MRQVYEHHPGSDWTCPATQSMYRHTFTGAAATQYLLSAHLALDEDDAVDILTMFMSEYGAFYRVDSGKEQEFENDADAHFAWIQAPTADDELQQSLNAEAEEDEVALDDIIIGFRHSYGGYHRLLKEYRQAGVDPTQLAIQNAMVERKKKAELNTPSSVAAERETEKDEHKKDKGSGAMGHIRSQSQKLLELMNSKKDLLRDKDKLREQMDESDEDDSDEDVANLNRMSSQSASENRAGGGVDVKVIKAGKTG